MRVLGRFAVAAGRTFSGMIAVAVALAACLGVIAGARAMQGTENDAASGVRIVHGIADAGPLDVYIDGSLALIGISFAKASDEINLAGGDHRFAVVPTGQAPDAAIVAGAITIRADVRYYVALLGSTNAANVGLFRIDDRPLEAGQARFRVINGVPDAGEIVPSFSGGEALSEPLAFGDAADYAAVDAGTYDLDILNAASGGVLLSIPQTEFAEGTTNDVLLVGLVDDASMQALVEAIAVTVTRPSGRTAAIVAGTCRDRGELVADLGSVQPGQGEEVGVAEASPVAQAFAAAAVPFATLTADSHAVVIAETADIGGNVVACGDIGGRLTETGSLVVALQNVETGDTAGVAVLAPGVDNPDSTGVSVFVMAGETAALPAATPAVNG
jgi:hypothetical protein